MVKLLVSVFLALGLTGQLLAQSPQTYIKLTLDSTEIYLGDAIVLEVESVGLLDPIDFSPLEANATVVRDTGGTRIAVIKGKVVEIAIKRIDLIPDKPGLIVIGPLLAGEVTSNSVHVNVLDEARPTWQPVTDDLQIKATLVPETPWVNQQTVFTIELLHRYPINNEEISLPDLAGFAKRPLIENRRTFKDDDKEWYRTQWQYLIFPTQSGPQTIGSIKWTGTATKSRVERAEFSRTHEPISLNVQAATVESGKWWLPASNLQLKEQWSSPVIELRAGDEVERTIIISAHSVLAGQIPRPDVPESRALQQTLINTTRKEELINKTMVSTAEFTYRVKAQSPIPVFLDTVRLPWWNTVENTAKEAIIPARRINVGLPDRVDLLTNIALQESGMTRAKHWLQSTNWLRNSVYIIAVFATLMMASLFIPWLLARAKQRSRLNKQARTMHTLANRGDTKGLYEFLCQPASRRLFASHDTEIINTLHSHLYSASSSTTPMLPLTDMVKAIEPLRRSVENAPDNHSDTLAKL